MTLTDNGNGTATLSGSSSVAPGVYTFTIQAANGVGPNATQLFTLTVGLTQAAVSLKFKGFINYANAGSLASGGFTITNTKGVITSVTGTGSIPGAKSGTATITVKIQRVSFGPLSAYIGTIHVVDPASHLDTRAIVFAGSLTPVGSTGISGTAFGLFYTLAWTV